LKTRFIKNAPSTKSPLVELLVHYKLWKEENIGEEDDEDNIQDDSLNLPQDDGWIFDTVKKDNASTINRESNITQNSDVTSIGVIDQLQNEAYQTWRTSKAESSLDLGTLKALKISETKSPRINWEAMLDSANALIPPPQKDNSMANIPERKASIPERTESIHLRKWSVDHPSPEVEKSEGKNSISSETRRQYHFNSTDNNNADNLRISWSSKRIGQNDNRTSHASSAKASSWSPYTPKPLCSTFFDARNQAIFDEHNFRKEEFIRLLDLFLEQVEKLEE
jgi:hypothetical protein